VLRCGSPGRGRTRYRERAKALAAEFATYDTTSEITTVLTDLADAAPAAT
jgi:hypothetical protein